MHRKLDYIMVNRNNLIAKKWHCHPNRTDMRYCIAQKFGGVIFWAMKPEDAFGWLNIIPDAM